MVLFYDFNKSMNFSVNSRKYVETYACACIKVMCRYNSKFWDSQNVKISCFIENSALSYIKTLIFFNVLNFLYIGNKYLLT